MDEILELYRNFKEEGIVDRSVYNYDCVNVVIDGQHVHVYDVSGKTPMGKYNIPNNEDAFIGFLKQINTKVKELGDNFQFICGRCNKTYDLPEKTRDRNGYLICARCAAGGDMRVEHPKRGDHSHEEVVEKSQPAKESPIPSTVGLGKKTEASPLTIQDAIAMLQKSGYAVKKVVKSYKVVYQNGNGEEGVSPAYFRSEEDFRTKHPDKKFISLIKELNKADEENI